MENLMLGQTADMMVTTSTEASYNSNGQMVSSFDQDETVLRLISEHDLVPEHEEGVVVLEGVTWMAAA